MSTRHSPAPRKAKLMPFESKAKTRQGDEPKPPFPKQHQPHPASKRRSSLVLATKSLFTRERTNCSTKQH